MNANVMSRVKGREKLGGICHDVDTNHKVGGRQVVSTQELNKGWGSLHKRV
jgi:hypothetical protein